MTSTNPGNRNPGKPETPSATATKGRRASLLTALKDGWLPTATQLTGIIGSVVTIVIAIYSCGPPATGPATGHKPPVAHAAPKDFDQFGGPGIDPENWQIIGRNADKPYVRDGQLHLEVTRQDLPELRRADQESIYALLRAKLPDYVTDVFFEIILVSTEGANEGGVYAKVFNQPGREHRVALKADGDLSEMEYYICQNSLCDNKFPKQFLRAPHTPITLGKPYRVHIYQGRDGWTLKFGDFPPEKVRNEDGPIQNFELYLFSEGAPFHIAIDNVEFSYT